MHPLALTRTSTKCVCCMLYVVFVVCARMCMCMYGCMDVCMYVCIRIYDGLNFNCMHNCFLKNHYRTADKLTWAINVRSQLVHGPPKRLT